MSNIISDLVVDSTDTVLFENEVCEVTYYNKAGQVIGRWAYGAYDETLPYRGTEDKCIVSKFPDKC